MAFGKRNIGKRLGEPFSGNEIHETSGPFSGYAASSDPATLSRLMVISVAGVVMLAAISALFFLQPGRGEPVEVEASLLDGSQLSAQAQGRVAGMCIEAGMLAATRGVDHGSEQRLRIANACECTVEGVVGRLTPLQMEMTYVDYRTRLRATLSEIDRTGERIAIDQMPKLEIRDGAPIALAGAASFQSHWREARTLVAQQAARCRS